MRRILFSSLAMLGVLTGCTALQTSVSPTNQAEVDSTTSALEELPPDVTVTEPEVPPLEPIVQGGEFLIGAWKSPCLIPDEKSDYAEQHYFEFYGNRLATHTRETYYKKSCTGGSDQPLINNYEYTIPSDGLINLTDLVTGQVLYDMYAANETTLKFGHGFRNTLPYPTTTGSSAADRITDLNTYIVYTKEK